MGSLTEYYMKPIAFRGARALGREALHAGAQILTDIDDKKPDARVKDIVATRLAEFAKRLLLKGRGKKRTNTTSANEDLIAKKKGKLRNLKRRDRRL